MKQLVHAVILKRTSINLDSLNILKKLCDLKSSQMIIIIETYKCKSSADIFFLVANEDNLHTGLADKTAN